MGFRNLFNALLSAAVCFPLFTASLAAAGEPRYNVLWIMADDMRCAAGCYGDQQAKTPNIDALASRGMLFERAYVQYPVCNPSRVSMLTSTRPESNGVSDNRTFFREKMPEVITLPELFRKSGGKAISYGKIFHAGQVEGEYDNRMLDSGRSWDEATMFKPTDIGARGMKRNLTAGALPWCVVGDMQGADDDQSDGQTALRTIAAMERGAEKRWFIGAGFHRPHDPFLVSSKYVEMFPAGSLALFRDPAEITPMPKMAQSGGAMQAAFDKFTDEDRMAFLRHYYGGVAQTDAQVGHLMQALDRLQLWDRTIVIFMGDHGYHLGERNWWNKNTLFERCCRAPLIIVAPGMTPGVSRSLVEFADLYPTVAELCGMPSPPTVTGRSLIPVMRDPASTVRDAAVTYVTGGAKGSGLSMRTDRWRYTEWSSGERELYDHSDDVEEVRNVAAANPAVVEELSKKLGTLRRPGA